MAETLLNESGQLGVTAAPIYTCPASTQAVVKRVSFVNTGAGARTANLFYRPSGGTLRQVSPVAVALPIAFQADFEGLETLSAGDTIEGDASVAAEVDYTVFGVEIT